MKNALMVEKNWWADADEDADAEIVTSRAIDRAFERKTQEARTRLELDRISREEKKKASAKIMNDVFEKRYTVDFWAEKTGFSHDSIRRWCRSLELKAHYIKGQYRITAPAMQSFIEREDQKRD